MADHGDQAGSKPPLQFVKSTGSLLTGRHRDKAERISETMSDLQLAIQGCSAQLMQSDQPGQFGQSVAAFARACSIFLRKMVTDEDRLLDDYICQSVQISFDRIKKIAEYRQHLDITLYINGGHMQLTKLDDNTLLPQHVYSVPIGPQRLDITIEWPLPGLANWTFQPTIEEPWQIRAEALFDTRSEPKLNCDNWLGQQLVMFDTKGVALKEVIKTTTNTEGAHSTNVSRLMRTENEPESKAVKNPEVQILSNIRVCGVKYNHIIVIETALYLYERLFQTELIGRPKGGVDMPIFCLVPESSSDVFSSHRDWIKFDGGMILSLGGEGRSISHRVRATK